MGWVEAEAVWPDGRRVFAVANLQADNGRPVISLSAPKPVASLADDSRGVFRFQRTGKLDDPLVVRFTLGGSAGKWSDYRRPEGDMPVEMTIPTGSDSVDMAIVPVAAGLGTATREVRVVLKPDPKYNVGSPREATVTLKGK